MSKFLTAVVYPAEHDLQSVILYEELMNRGAKPLMIPFGLKDQDAMNEVEITNGIIKIKENLSNLKAVYVRGLSVDVPLMLPPYINRIEYNLWQARYLKENLKIDFWMSLLKRLEESGVLVVNDLTSYMHHDSKMQMYYRLHKQGLPVPYTFTTNDIGFLKKELKQRKLVMKSSAGIGATVPVTKKILGRGMDLSECPVLFQEYIEGDTIRVHTVADKVVLSLKIFANDTDSRTDTAGFEYYELTRKQSNIINMANKLLGIKFSAWDVIIDKSGMIYLLDCNPGPYIGWIGGGFTRIVMSGLADLMSSYIRNGSYDQAAKAVNIKKPEIKKVMKIGTDLMHLVSHGKDFKDKLNVRH